MKALQKGWMLLAHAIALTVTLIAIFAWNSQKSSRSSSEVLPTPASINLAWALEIAS